MKTIMKVLSAATCLATILTCTACGDGATTDPDLDRPENCTIAFSDYEGIEEITDVSEYDGGVATNLPVKNGVVYSPFYHLKINGVSVPVYAARTASGAHSFAYIDVEKTEESKPFLLRVEIGVREASSVLSAKNPSVAVLPESSSVLAEIDGREVKASIKDYGSYSFAFNKKPEQALTLMVAPKEDTKTLFGDYEIEYVEPGDYSVAEHKAATVFNQPNKVYYFKAGRYKTDTVSLPSDSILYLERNAYLEVMPPENAYSSNALHARGRNVTVAGRGLMDFSACCGGETPEGYHNDKGGIIFDHVEKASLSGITVINSQTWTVCMNACRNVRVNRCMLFSYRVFSDGIMLSDCIGAVVEENFIHTGDDAFETKSTTSSEEKMRNILFRRNAAWTDKAVAYGCIYESNKDTSGVRFEDCSVGFAMGTWSNHLGCCVIQMGDRKGAVMSEIRFENVEVYYNRTPGLLNVYIGGSGGRGAGFGTVKDIYFKNIRAKLNYGAYLNLHTYDSENCFIYDLYLDDIVSNGVKLTAENIREKGKISLSVAGGYDLERYLHLNEKSA